MRNDCMEQGLLSTSMMCFHSQTAKCATSYIILCQKSQWQGAVSRYELDGGASTLHSAGSLELDEVYEASKKPPTE